MIIEFECQFEKWNILTQQHEMRWDYVKAETEAQARNALAWKHGDVIDVLSCNAVD
jgi:hypothetical protein